MNSLKNICRANGLSSTSAGDFDSPKEKFSKFR